MAFNFSKATSASATSEAGATPSTPSTPSTQPLDQVQTTAPAVHTTQVDNAQPIHNNAPNILKLAGAMKVIPIVQTTSQSSQSSQSSEAPVLSDSQLYQTQIITTNLTTLKAKLEAKIPDLHDNIRIIMKSLQSDPVQVTILTNEERSMLFRSMSTIADVDLVLDAAKAAKKKIDLAAPENANLFE